MEVDGMKDSTRRTLRTALASALALAAAAPAVYEAVGGDQAAAGGWLAGIVALCATITRVMTIPAVDRSLSRFGLGSRDREELLEKQGDIRGSVSSEPTPGLERRAIP